MDLAKQKLPDTVEVSGIFYPINTGHSYWFRFFQLLKDKETVVTEFDYLYIGDPPEDRAAGFRALLAFAYEKKEIPRVEGDTGTEKLLDYDIDADLIWCAIKQCYGVDLFEGMIHWHKVRAMLSAIPGTRLNEVIGWRCYSGNDQHMLRLKRMWALPEEPDEESKKNLEEFNTLLG